MKAYASSYVYLPREQWKIIDIPDDLMVQPVPMSEEGLRLCHSDSNNLWYVLTSINRPGDDVYQAVFDSGTWLDCYESMANPYYNNVPFKWGEPIKSKDNDRILYYPIWQSVPTGEMIEEDGWEHEVYKEVYKIVRMYLDQFPHIHENVYQSNQYTQFEILEYDTHLRNMVTDLQNFTGITF